MTSSASMASTTSTALFYQRTSWFWWLDHPWHQKHQYWPLFVEWIIKNPIVYWYLIPSLLKAVEVSQCYFFENWLMKVKFPNLLKPLGTLIQENYWSFYPSEPFRIPRFNMRHPVFYNILQHLLSSSTLGVQEPKPMLWVSGFRHITPHFPGYEVSRYHNSIDCEASSSSGLVDHQESYLWVFSQSFTPPEGRQREPQGQKGWSQKPFYFGTLKDCVW